MGCRGRRLGNSLKAWDPGLDDLSSFDARHAGHRGGLGSSDSCPPWGLTEGLAVPAPGRPRGRPSGAYAESCIGVLPLRV